MHGACNHTYDHMPVMHPSHVCPMGRHALHSEAFVSAYDSNMPPERPLFDALIKIFLRIARHSYPSHDVYPYMVICPCVIPIYGHMPMCTMVI